MFPSRWVFLPIAVAVLLSLLSALPVQAADPFSEDPGTPCLGPDDPFCTPDEGGGGGGSNPPCEECFQIPEGPSGEPSYWTCVQGDPLYDTQVGSCSASSSGCFVTNFCTVA